MEFYVVDPKDRDFGGWTNEVRSFLVEKDLPFVETGGALYFLGDDIATPWHEDSVVFKVEGEEGGIIEVRDSDRAFYVYTDDFKLLDDRDFRESVGYRPHSPDSLYGFKWGNEKGCRFHLGPAKGVSYLCGDEETDHPPQLSIGESWMLLFSTMRWIGGSMSRLQDLKGFRAEKITLDFSVDVAFKHPASLDALNELLSEEEGYERTKKTLRATFRDRDASWIKRFIEDLPTDPADFGEAQFRVIWRGTVNGKDREITYCGLERRNLRPFVQMPLHATSKSFLDHARTAFKGHRIDRQEYLLD
jgi:hypothetical protein